MEVMVGELAHLYEAFSQGRESALPELEIQYADYAMWQREWLQGEVLHTQLEYWKRELEGVSVLELPTDRARPAAASNRGASERIELCEEVTEKLKQMSQREGVTLFMSLLAGFQVLLARYSGQTDIAVGTPIAGRNRREIEGLIGFFVNTLVMRVDVGGNPSVREMLGRVREAALGAYAHQDVPFEKLVEELQPERSLSHTPLFQVMMAFQSRAVSEVEIGELKVGVMEVEARTAKFDLLVSLQDRGRELSGVVEYNSDLYEATSVQRLVGHFEVLMKGLITDANQRLSQLPMMSERERQQIVVEWNKTAAEYPRDRCIHEIFEQQVEQTPDAVAVVYEGEHLTYYELNRRANQLAHYLREKGVGPEVKVGLCVERSLEMIIGLVGVMKAGGAYLPIDPGNPEERIRYMLSDSGAKVVLVQGRFKERVGEICANIVELEQSAEEVQEGSGKNLEVEVSGENLAYVIYTSGSTGIPKGVEIEHGGVANLIAWHQRIYNVNPTDRATQVAGTAFDACVWELWPYLTAGASIHIANDEIYSSPSSLSRWLAEERISLCFLPTPLAEVMINQQSLSELALRALLVGGDRLHQAPQEHQSFSLVNHYGPTENTVVTTYALVEAGTETQEAPPIGQPIANTEVYLLDEWLNPIPIGVAGELYIGGVGLARGYQGRAELTGEKFLPNPFSQEGGARMYRSGDLTRYRSDGNLEYLDRINQQVKIRGYRIELGEIEAVLNEHPSVEQVIVVAREDEEGERRLVGYVVGRQQISSQELREYLRERLPDYMVPGAILQLEAMPLTANGKVDRGALPKPEMSGAGREYEGARTAVEEIVSGIWAEVLRVDRVGIRDNFFELGGHSLLATQVVSRVRKVFGVEVSLRSLFTDATVAAMASEVEQQQRSGVGAAAEAITRVARDEELLLSYAQQRLWFIDQLEPGSAAYNIPSAVRLMGKLDEQALRRSLNEIVRRHEVLRTSFPSSDGEPRQEIHENGELRPDIIDLMQGDEAEREERLQEVLREEARRGFDLSSGPLIRAKLIRMSEDEHVLMVNMHHIVSDGWSMEVIVRELAQLYEAYTQGREPSLPELEIQYADYAMWQREWLQGEVLQTQLEYWKRELEGVSVLELPMDRARPAAASNRGASERIELCEEVTENLKQMSRREGVTLFMSLMAGFQVLLGRYSGQSDIAVGTPIAGRNRREIEGLIGFFVNTLVMRVDVGGNPSVREMLGRVREAALGAYAHQDVPFEKLVEELQPERSLSHTPLFQVMMAFQSRAVSEVEIGELRAGVMEVEARTAKFDLLVSLRDRGRELSGVVEYNSDLYEATSVRRLVGHFEVLMKGLMTDANQRLSHLPMMSEAEKRHLILELNETAADYDRDICIHQVIEARAQATPDSTALVCKDQRISYGQLDVRSNQVANYLRLQGVGPEVRVGLMMGRSIEMVVWMLGILKAGGAYVPIDPAYPKSRRELIIEDSGLELIVSDHSVAEVRETVRQQSAERVASGVRSSNLGYVIYTSGSTGRPKGVGLEHRGVIGLMKWAERTYKREEMEGVLATTSICFDLSVYEILVVLGLGGKVIVGRSGLEVREEIEGGEVVQLNTVPSLMEGVLREGELNASIKVVNLAGEALSRVLVEEVYARSRVERVVNLYGPSEDTTYTTMEEEERGSQKRVGIGRGIENTRIYIADERGEMVARGVRGEIYIGSESLARCYIGKGEATAERFVPDGWSGERGERVYKTGDVGRYNKEGRIEYVGRKDQQVKVRGYRIELGEIEEVLRGMRGIREAAVKVVEGVEGGKRLVGYVVEEEGEERSGEEIRRRVREELPEAMVPGEYVKLRELPKTPNGKIDRRALPKPERGEASREYVGPRSAVEEIVSGIWAEVLRVERVGIRDNFFELGGHSLLATQVVRRVRKVFGVEVSLRSLFTDATVAAMASEVEQQQRSGEGAVAG